MFTVFKLRYSLACTEPSGCCSPLLLSYNMNKGLLLKHRNIGFGFIMSAVVRLSCWWKLKSMKVYTAGLRVIYRRPDTFFTLKPGQHHLLI